MSLRKPGFLKKGFWIDVSWNACFANAKEAVVYQSDKSSGPRNVGQCGINCLWTAVIALITRKTEGIGTVETSKTPTKDRIIEKKARDSYVEMWKAFAIAGEVSAIEMRSHHASHTFLLGGRRPWLSSAPRLLERLGIRDF